MLPSNRRERHPCGNVAYKGRNVGTKFYWLRFSLLIFWGIKEKHFPQIWELHTAFYHWYTRQGKTMQGKTIWTRQISLCTFDVQSGISRFEKKHFFIWSFKDCFKVFKSFISITSFGFWCTQRCIFLSCTEVLTSLICLVSWLCAISLIPNTKTNAGQEDIRRR